MLKEKTLDEQVHIKCHGHITEIPTTVTVPIIIKAESRNCYP